MLLTEVHISHNRPDCTTENTNYNAHGKSLLLDELIQIKFKQVSFFLFIINYMKKKNIIKKQIFPMSIAK